MIRLLARSALAILANAVGLLAANWLVEGFSIDATALISAVLIFTIATVILGPLIIKMTLTGAPALMGGIALVTTLVGLLITTLVTDGLSISGASAWVMSTLIIWLCSLLAGFLLPMLLFKKTLDNKNSTPPAQPSV